MGQGGVEQHVRNHMVSLGQPPGQHGGVHRLWKNPTGLVMIRWVLYPQLSSRSLIYPPTAPLPRASPPRVPESGEKHFLAPVSVPSPLSTPSGLHPITDKQEMEYT